mmetsp:Transcript_24020/g.60841  ORF Transcript_24020/g.60841 Transcript_24020/m.60841 type:complete len:189 (-) Transcript_24020:111-677(-)
MNLMPCFKSFDWNHGTFLGTVCSSETTAAAEGKRGVLRNDPFAMKPFCGYNIGDYFQHWISLGQKHGSKGNLPRIFYTNWFRKNEAGKFIWPGFGENSRVLRWIFDRADGVDNAEETAIGYVPTVESIDISSLSLSNEEMKELLKVDRERWLEEVENYKRFYDKDLEGVVPKAIYEQLDLLRDRLSKA